jgi:hypothetical protein
MLAVAVTTGFGQTVIVVDEFGVGTIGVAPLPSGLVADPFNGGLPHLAYTLPFISAGGPFDILLTEPPDGQQQSDILRFVPGLAGPTTTLFFYSDATDGADALADLGGLPNSIGGPLPPFLETGLFENPYTEAGPNGLVYVVGPGGPGSDGNPAGTSYTFISDPVPEPNSVVLLLGGLGIYGLIHVLRRKAAQS